MKKLMIFTAVLMMGLWVSAQSTSVDYYKNGNVKTATYTAGDYTEVTEYFKSGKLKRISRYVNGVAEGLWLEYNRKETLILQGTYSSGQKIGEWLVYNPTDKLVYKVVYENDEKVSVSEWAHNKP